MRMYTLTTEATGRTYRVGMAQYGLNVETLTAVDGGPIDQNDWADVLNEASRLTLQADNQEDSLR